MKQNFLYTALLLASLTLTACPTTGAPGGATTPEDNTNTTNGNTSGGNASAGGSASVSGNFTKAQYIQAMQCYASKNPEMSAAITAQISSIEAIPDSTWAVVSAQASYQTYMQQAVAAACAS